MTETNETTIFEEGSVKITNHRAVINGITYMISNVKSISMVKTDRKKYAKFIWAGSFLILIGFVVFVSSFSSDGGECLILVISAIGAFLVRNLTKTTYSLKIVSALGESNVSVVQDEEYIKKVVDAMNEAIVRRS